jgi:hypothetical protein
MYPSSDIEISNVTLVIFGLLIVCSSDRSGAGN